MSDAVAAVAALWLRYRTRMFDRLAAVEAAVLAARAGTLQPDVRAHACREAHKLAGSLGTFGLHEGTAPARALEHGLGEDAALDIAALEGAAAALRSVLERAPA